MKTIRHTLLVCATAALSACVVVPPDTVAGEQPLYPQPVRRVYEGNTVIYRDYYPVPPASIIIYDEGVNNDLIRQQRRLNELQRARAEREWEERQRERQRYYDDQLVNRERLENQRLRNELRRREQLERQRENMRRQNDILRREDRRQPPSTRPRNETGGRIAYPPPQLNNNRQTTPPAGTPRISTSPSTNVCRNGQCR